MGKYALAFESDAYLYGDPRYDWWVAANEATVPQRHNASFGAHRVEPFGYHTSLQQLTC